ncbi:phospholipid-transporting ATPase ABCA3-like [Sitodiplosis mosellana]|uniref:phospholipid-transporting ATPase ABCA3-like n=1 Tax=Sitodiplosis mosellana TaxID=263140 RepID=UPI002444A589|nr:phospholipid-transporting ATPase ABCA3-like [Sitodiplosis mosellana]
MLNLEGFVSVDTSEQIEDAIVRRGFLAGIEFDHSNNIQELPNELIYSLRVPHFPRDSGNDIQFYLKQGFLSVQDAIARSFIQLKHKSETVFPNISMSRYPDRVDIVLLDNANLLGNVLAILTLFSLVFLTINTVIYINAEKEKQLKEVMKIMGLQSWLHWTSWFVRTMFFMLINITMIAAILKISLYADFTVLWVFLFVYAISTTTFCFMMSELFTKANIAAIATCIVWFVLYIPFWFSRTTYTSKLIACISFNTAIAHGIQLICQFEITEEGVKWADFWKPTVFEDDVTLGILMLYMLASSLLHLLIALYVEKVMPGDYGVPEKWYFPFTKRFWFGIPFDACTESDAISSNPNIETDPSGYHVGVRVNHLHKIYSNKKVAVNHLTLNIFDDQITVLLGHNGAGKTTAMLMLTGMLPPSSGSAIINGYDIRKNIQKARSSIGLCPQHNILFDELTVREHMEFYARLKGMSKSEVQNEVDRYTAQLEMESMIDKRSKDLSGGMKRKLSVALALCGESKVVFLDEPTSGMDPAARRHLWDLLLNEKKGRTILMTTHFMDEADVLGDRVAIMADGELKCYGTPFFLKKRFGSGYRLVCVKNNGCNSGKITELLRTFIPNIGLHKEVAGELTYILPVDYVNKFEEMFQCLEEKQNELNLNSFGVSLTPLEEVFLKVASESGDIEALNSSDIGADFESLSGTAPLLRGFMLHVNQWHAMLRKRFFCWIRSWITVLLQNLIPVTLIVAIILTTSEQSTEDEQTTTSAILLDRYGKTVTMLQRPTACNTTVIESIFSQYRDSFKNQSPDAVLDEFSEDIQTRYLEKAKTNLPEVNSRYLAGMSIGENCEILAWFIGKRFDTSALSLSLMHNAMVKTALGINHNIQVTDFPVARRNGSRTIYQMPKLFEPLVTILSFGMAFVSCFYIIFHIRERVTKAKLLQMVSGVSVCTFWLTSFLFDFITYMLTTAIVIITLAACGKEGWSGNDLWPIMTVLTVFGVAALPMMYLFSFLFSNSAIGFVWMMSLPIINFVLQFIIFSLTVDSNDSETHLVRNSNDSETHLVRSIFIFLPHYALDKCLSSLDKNKENVYAWKEPGIGFYLFFMIITGIVFFATLFLIEFRVFPRIFCCMRCNNSKKESAAENDDIDDDIKEETQKIHAMTPNDLQVNNLVLQKLMKSYGELLAVNQISVAIKRAECFGLLGENGAGKTSTFKMLTGEEQISSGEAFVQGVRLKTNMMQVRKIIGYCPQFDALLDDLTGSETLEIFALLRGVRYSDVPILKDRLANELTFKVHINKKIREYSGGNKRKLSTALALIGNPAVVYLDEPTTGMDPAAKRKVWSLLSKVRLTGKAIVLSSHSMDECEALCTRLAIMVNGEFKCLGSTQHLKNKFSKGFWITIKMLETAGIDSETQHHQISNIKDYIKQNFPGSDLSDEYQGILKFSVSTSDLKWSSMFGLMNQAKETLPIEDYSISQSSLEQVFLSLTQYQH